MRILRLLFTLIIIIPGWISALISRKYDKYKKHKILKKWCNLIIKTLGFKLVVSGEENVLGDIPIYFVSNHQGTFDPAIIVASCPVPLSFISKKQNKNILIIGSWAKTVNTIYFDRDVREDNIYMLRESARRLKAKDNILIFPEGTRSMSSKVNSFKVGSIQPSYLAKACIVPVVLSNSFAFDNLHSKNITMRVDFLKPIKYEEYKNYSQEEIAIFLHDLIEKEVIPL